MLPAHQKAGVSPASGAMRSSVALESAPPGRDV
jgi:hypothetical protein